MPQPRIRVLELSTITITKQIVVADGNFAGEQTMLSTHPGETSRLRAFPYRNSYKRNRMFALYAALAFLAAIGVGVLFVLQQ